jgi:superfamily II DNA or RNA helicase
VRRFVARGGWICRAQATLNGQQEKAVAGATGGKGITLIQGPPGTGKTHCALRIITKWLQQRKAELLNVIEQRRERVAQLEGACARFLWSWLGRWF